MTIKNRGAKSNPEGRFEIHTRDAYDDGWDELEEELPPLETILYPENSKSVITRNDSPDIGFEQSINPYRGCEHGCIYCYARPSHAYMNLSPGIDFETKIFYKNDAAKLLEIQLSKPKYIPQPIMLGANTDPYQPAESKLKVTRNILEVLQRYQHPVAIITKNSMIERDIDILTDMANKQLVKVAVSITTLRNDLKHIMEPRTSSPKARLRIVQKLTAANIPVRVMTAPIIPMINDMELENILKESVQAGAKFASYVLIRLPYEVKDLFKEWLNVHFKDRATHVMSIIKQMRGDKEYDSTWGKRMSGEGQFARLLAHRFDIARKRFKLNTTPPTCLSTEKFVRPRINNNKQLDLWDKLDT